MKSARWGRSTVERRMTLCWVLAAVVVSGCGDGAPAPGAAVSGSGQVSDGGQGGVVSGDERYVAVIAAREAVDVASRHAGILVEILVRPGEPVAEGDILARLDEKPMAEALAMARAERASAQATLAQRDVAIEEAASKLATEEKLAAGGVGARQALDDARFALEKARKARDIARSQLSQQQASIVTLSRQLEEAAIKAPFAGTIALRYRDPGALVAQGTAVVRLIRTDSLWVKFAVPPDHAARFAIGDAVSAELESPDISLSATIRHISPELDPAARLIFIEAELTVPAQWQGRLRSGLPAWVRRT